MLRRERAERSSNYYGFSGSNSPDGNTTQFTHADCAREDVNSCQSDGPFHLLFFAGAPNRHRGRRWTIIRFSTFSSPVLRRLPSVLARSLVHPPPPPARFSALVSPAENVAFNRDPTYLARTLSRSKQKSNFNGGSALYWRLTRFAYRERDNLDTLAASDRQNPHVGKY